MLQRRILSVLICAIFCLNPLPIESLAEESAGVKEIEASTSSPEKTAPPTEEEKPAPTEAPEAAPTPSPEATEAPALAEAPEVVAPTPSLEITAPPLVEETLHPENVPALEPSPTGENEYEVEPTPIPERHPYLMFAQVNGGFEVASCDGDVVDATVSETFSGQAVVAIGEEAFSGLKKLKAVALPEGLRAIGRRAFAECPSLEEVRLPKSVDEIAEDAFEDSPRVILRCAAGSSAYDFAIAHGLTPEDAQASATEAPEDVDPSATEEPVNMQPSAVETVEGEQPLVVEPLEDGMLVSGEVVPREATIQVKSSASQYDYWLNDDEISVTIYGYLGSETALDVPAQLDGYTVTVIGSMAFYNNARLTSVALPDTVTTIEDSAFSGCSSLTAIDLPGGLTSLGDKTFKDCTSLRTIDLPDGLTSLEYQAFYHCTSLTTVHLPDRLTLLGREVFYDCWLLKAIDLPGGVTSIGDSAFEFCSSLTAVHLPDGVTSLGYGTFSGCTSLTAIDLPDAMTSLGDATFEDCVLLKTIDLPDGLTSIGYNTFIECYSLNSIDLPDTVTTIGLQAFVDCRSLTAIDLPDGLTSIENSAFMMCTSLTAIDLPDGLTSLGKYAFQCCDALSRVSFGAEISAVSMNDFFGDDVLKSIVIRADDVEISDLDMIDDFPNLTFYVCAGSGAEQFMKNHGLRYVIIGQTEPNYVTGITLTASSHLLSIGGSMTISASVEPEDADPSVQWSSSNPGIASVDGGGIIRGMKAGKCKITATASDGGGASATFDVTVGKYVTGITLIGANVLGSGRSATIKAIILPKSATKRTVKWSSSNLGVATVRGNGVVKAKPVAVATGVTITATAADGSGVAASHSMTIYPVVTAVNIATPKKYIDFLAQDRTLQLSASCVPGNALQDIAWNSSNTKIATVDGTGKVTAFKLGSVTITATARDGSGKSAKVTIAVVNAVRSILIVGPMTLTAGKSTQLKLTFTPTNATNKGVKWSSNNAAAAKISSSGKVIAKKVKSIQTVVFTAASAENPSISATHSITVYPVGMHP